MFCPFQVQSIYYLSSILLYFAKNNLFFLFFWTVECSCLLFCLLDTMCVLCVLKTVFFFFSTMRGVCAGRFYSKRGEKLKTCFRATNDLSDGSSSSDDERPCQKRKACQMVVMDDDEIFGGAASDPSEERWPRTLPKGHENIAIPETDISTSSNISSSTQSSSAVASASAPVRRKKKFTCKSVMLSDRYASCTSKLQTSSQIPKARRKCTFSSASDVPPQKSVVLPSKRSAKLCKLSQNINQNKGKMS